MTTPKPGVYRNVPVEEYFAWDAVNQSTLNLFRRTPAHVRYELDHGGKEPTDAMHRGHLLHLAVLEPKRFEAEVVCAPKLDRRTKRGKEMWAAFAAENAGKELVSEADHAELVAMARSVHGHETCREFFGGAGANELCIVWEDPEFGLLCKARIDRVSDINGWPIVGDLKSTRSAARTSWQKSVEQYGYHVQAAHTLAGLDVLAPQPGAAQHRRWFWFCVESAPPYLAAAYEIDDQALEEGYRTRSRYMAKWKQCIESHRWPGYPAHEYAGLPPWAYKSYIDD